LFGIENQLKNKMNKKELEEKIKEQQQKKDLLKKHEELRKLEEKNIQMEEKLKENTFLGFIKKQVKKQVKGIIKK